jgi:hypothetical protein
LPVSYSVDDGHVEVCCLGASQEGLSSIGSFGQREDEYILKLSVDQPRAGGQGEQETHSKSAVSYGILIVNDYLDCWLVLAHEMGANIIDNILPEEHKDQDEKHDENFGIPRM